MAEKAGLDCELYRNTATWASPTWNVCDNVIDVTIPFARTKIEVKRRGSDYKKYLGGLIDAPVTVKMIADEAETDYMAFKAAFLAKTAVNLAIADGAIATAGTVYHKADFVVLDMQIGEPLEDVRTVDIVFGYDARSANEPTNVTVS